MKSLSHFVLALGTCAAIASPLAHAAAFQNGSFELPGSSGPAFSFLPAGNTSVVGWITDGYTVSNPVFYQIEQFGVVARDGKASIGFGANGATGGRISQSFDTVMGQSYTVSFATTAQQSGSGAQSYLAEALNLSPGGSPVLLGSQLGSIPVGDNAWVDHSFLFIAASAVSQLRFADTSNGAAAGGINWALDAVSVSSAITVTPVPEPSTYALMLLGLAATAGLARKKSAKAKRTEG